MKSFLFSSPFETDPIANFTVTGSTWITHDQLLELNVKFTGSPPFHYCAQVIKSMYNVTGNETCSDWMATDQHEYSLRHYSLGLEPYTILLITKNQVTINRKAIAINMYDVKKQSQLSVIVVPVIFILIAITSVIFGVAKYVETRNR